MDALAKTQGEVISLPLGRARRPWVFIRRQTSAFRRVLESAVVNVHGGIDLRRAKLVRTACTAFESAQRIRRQLAYGGEPGADGQLDHGTWLAYDGALQARESACDKALLALGLDRDSQEDLIDLLYRQPVALPAAQDAATDVPNAQGDDLPTEPVEALDAAVGDSGGAP